MYPLTRKALRYPSQQFKSIRCVHSFCILLNAPGHIPSLLIGSYHWKAKLHKITLVRFDLNIIFAKFGKNQKLFNFIIHARTPVWCFEHSLTQQIQQEKMASGSKGTCMNVWILICLTRNQIKRLKWNIFSVMEKIIWLMCFHYHFL